MNYKAVICDLDGTLLNSEHVISEYTKSVIKKVKAKGIRIFIATGRHHIDAMAFKDLLNLESFLISSNGAKIHDEFNNEIVSHNISNELTEKIINFSIDSSIHKNIYKDDEWFVEEDLADAVDFHKESGFFYEKKAFTSFIGNSVTKFFYICDDTDKIQRLEEDIILNFKGQLSFTLSQPHCLELMSRGVSKGRAIEEILKKEGIDLSEAIAFGDGLNDLDMLGTVGRGLIMGNCNYKLSKALPHNEVIETNDQDGVARYLEKLFLS